MIADYIRDELKTPAPLPKDRPDLITYVNFTEKCLRRDHTSPENLRQLADYVIERLKQGYRTPDLGGDGDRPFKELVGVYGN